MWAHLRVAAEGPLECLDVQALFAAILVFREEGDGHHRRGRVGEVFGKCALSAQGYSKGRLSLDAAPFVAAPIALGRHAVASPGPDRHA
jgi:hypothetical protein